MIIDKEDKLKEWEVGIKEGKKLIIRYLDSKKMSMLLFKIFKKKGRYIEMRNLKKKYELANKNNIIFI